MRNETRKPITGDHHNLERINKAELINFQDYLTLFREGILLNLDFRRILPEKYAIAGEVEQRICEIFRIDPCSPKNRKSDLRGMTYEVLKRIMQNPEYHKGNELGVTRSVLASFLEEKGVEGEVTDEAVSIFLHACKNSTILTRLDLASVDPRCVSSKDIWEVLYEETGIDPESDGAEERLLEAINFVFAKAITKMSKNMFLRIPQEYFTEKGKWNSVEDFIDFMYGTSPEYKKKRKGYKRVIDCAVLTVMDAYSEIFQNPDVVMLTKELESLVSRIKTIPGMTIMNDKDGDVQFSYNALDGEYPSHVRGRLTFRTKESAKILLKLLYNRKYNRLDFFSDLIGFRVEVENQEMGERAVTLFNREMFTDQGRLDDKGFLSPNFLRHSRIRIGSVGRKPSTSEDFINASLKGEVRSTVRANGSDQDLSVEVQFVYVGNRNEDGYAKHEIYDTKKILSAIARTCKYLTIDDIKIVIKNVALKSGLDEEGILRHLFLPSVKGAKAFLIHMGFPGTGLSYFTTKEAFSKDIDRIYRTDCHYSNISESGFKEVMRHYGLREKSSGAVYSPMESAFRTIKNTFQSKEKGSSQL